MTKQENIRNFVIISHVDHGKSTLADRLLEQTGTIEKHKMIPQVLDRHPIERQRGITIKMQPVRMSYHFQGQDYVLNLIDTPGHIDFSYEVSRALACVEGAFLLVDATQGVQAQTLTTFFMAKEKGLNIIPIINKIDLPHAEIESVKAELQRLVPGSPPILVSAKTGQGVDEVLKAAIQRVDSPQSSDEEDGRALVFDSIYDLHRGVIAHVRVFDGFFKANDYVQLIHSKEFSKIVDLGYFKPDLKSQDILKVGEIGYIVTQLKYIRSIPVGDTVIKVKSQKLKVKNQERKIEEKIEPLQGFNRPQTMVWATIYPNSPVDTPLLRDAIEKLQLNDASLEFEPDHSPALGAGFRLGVLGLLHLEIVLGRLQQEFSQEVIVTRPSVPFEITDETNHTRILHSADDLPTNWQSLIIKEPWIHGSIITPLPYLGRILDLIREHRGTITETKNFSNDRVILVVELPLMEVVIDFYDLLKSSSSGYASFSYKLFKWDRAELVPLDIRVSDQIIMPCRQLVHKTKANELGRQMVERLSTLIPRQQFEIKVQAEVAGKIIASERIAPFRKDVTAKLYGGDVTRKLKLLEKQKKGKKRLRALGDIELSPAFFHAVLRK